MLGLLLLVSFTSPVTLLPPPCRQCCDDLELLEGSGSPPPAAGFGHVPEVRTYINMTILKGTIRVRLR